MRNAADARLLERPAHRDRIAQALTRAIRRALGR
jgi:N-acetylmuramoyl-L-alanine amidase